MTNKPYGVKADRLWLGARVSKIGEPYASQIEKEIDEYISSAILQARSQAYEECAKIAEAFGAPRASRPPPGELQGIRETVWEGMDELRRSQAQAISQAIRQHSQKGEGNG